MENNNKNVAMMMDCNSKVQGNSTKFRLDKLKNGFGKIAEQACEAMKNIDWSFPQIHINWFGILVVVILANMAQKGMLDEMPNLKWLLESTIRLLEWLIGLLHNLVEWVIELPEPNIIGIGKMLEDWLRNMFAI